MTETTDLSQWSLADLTRALARNAPAHPTTWAACPLYCGGYGRGGGPCWGCLRAELARRVGEDEAARVCVGIITARDAATAPLE